MRIVFDEPLIERKLEKRLDSPKIIHSKILSKRLSHGRNIDIDIMDFSQTRTGSHKSIKAKHALDYVDNRGKNIALLITSGNAKKAFDIEAEYHPIQVINFMTNVRKYIDVQDLGKNRYSVVVKLPDRWFTPKKLENFWRKLVTERIFEGREIRNYKRNRDYNKLIKILDRRFYNYQDAVAVTNISDYSDDVPYCIDEIVEEINEYDYCIVPIGIGELFSGFQKARKKAIGFLEGRLFNKPAKLIGVTSYANPLSPYKRKNSDANKLDTAKPGREHSLIVGRAGKETYFCSLPNEAIDAAYGLLDGKVRVEEHKDLRTSLTGAVGCGVLLNKDNLHLYSDGIEIKNTYRFENKEFEPYKKERAMEPLFIEEGSRVLIVNTGGYE